MTYKIPAKTFLLGEYVALIDGPAILLTTTPCFETTYLPHPVLQGIHEQSPAGRYWVLGCQSQGISFYDPYDGKGGLGASTAQFLAVHQMLTGQTASCLNKEKLLSIYKDIAQTPQGTKPSGYDLLAQTQEGCVYIHEASNKMSSFDWPFTDIDFLLIRGKTKISTHLHLQDFKPGFFLDILSMIAEQGYRACLSQDSQRIVEAVTEYQRVLSDARLTIPYTQQLLARFLKDKPVLAAKGCGALGADVILLLIKKGYFFDYSEQLKQQGFSILGSSRTMH